MRLEGQAHPTYYDRYLDRTILSMPHYPPHCPHLAAARRELESWLFFYFEPRERMRAANPVKEVRHIGPMGEELAAFLRTLQALEPRQFAALEKALRVVMPNIEGIEVDVSDLGEVELRLRENGVAIPARVLSEGTLRVLGLLALSGIGEGPALVGFEEPENGVHPRRIQLIAELLKTQKILGATQYIVTTHSPVLPDLLPDDSLLAVRRSGRRTRIDPFSALGAAAARQGHRLRDGRRGSTPSRLAAHHARGFRCVTLRFSSSMMLTGKLIAPVRCANRLPDCWRSATHREINVMKNLDLHTTNPLNLFHRPRERACEAIENPHDSSSFPRKSV